MDENLRSAASKITAVYTVVIGFICLGAGLFTTALYPLKVWYMGVLLIPLSVVIIIESIRLFRNMKREKIISDAEQLTIKQLLQNNQPSSPTIITGEAKTVQHPRGDQAMQVAILARWGYTPAQWQQFLKWEKKERKMETYITMFLVVVMGVFLLRISREAPWWAAITVSTVIALLYGVISYSVAMNSIKLNSKNAEVVVTKDAVLVNGNYNRLNGENLWFEKVQLKNAGNFKYIEFTTGSKIRTGNTTNDIRVPVPYGKETEAEALVKEFLIK
jgi:hypothetical protein